MKKIFLLFILFMFFLSTSISSKAYATLPLTFDSINTGTIRDQDDDGNPDFIDWTGWTIIEVDERIISDTWSLARRGVIEFEIDDLIRDIKISSAQIDLFQTGWPNDSVEWYIATDDDGIIGINDWYNTGALDSGTIIRSTSGIDTIDITVALQSLIENNADYFRIGLKMVDPDVSHALFYGQDATDSPILRVVPEPISSVPLDIKPQSCPNPLNVGKKGVLPAAILGTEDFDVTQVDLSTVLLAGAAPLRSALEDVATPFEPFTGKEDALDCTDEGPDGFLDLTRKFDPQEIVEALGEVEDGEVIVLTLTGNLLEEFGGTPIEGEDVVVILKK